MKNEKRLIDANALSIQVLDASYWDNQDEDVVWNLVQDAPTIEAVEVVHGEWCEDYETFIDDSGKESYPIQTGYVCSECGKDGYPNWHYCPNCGAKNGRTV